MPAIGLLWLLLSSPSHRRVVRSISFVVPVLVLYGSWSAINYRIQSFFGLSPVGRAVILLVAARSPEAHEALNAEGPYQELRKQIQETWPAVPSPMEKWSKSWHFAIDQYGGLPQANVACGTLGYEIVLERPDLYLRGFWKNLIGEIKSHWITQYNDFFGQVP